MNQYAIESAKAGETVYRIGARKTNEHLPRRK